MDATEHNLAKWLAGEMDEAEFASFKASPEYADYERIASASLDFRTDRFDEDAMLSQVMSAQKRQAEPKVIPFYRSAIFRVAAILVLALGLFFVFGQDAKIMREAAAGQTASVVLPDDSNVELNSGSKITYDKASWYQHRELALEGEAYFKVAKGQVFDVNTNLGKVTVVGTQFNVKSRDQRFEVQCYEGKVLVSFNGSTQLLTPGKMVIFENGARTDSDIEDAQPAWTKGEIAFVSASLDDVVAELQRHFNVKIVLQANIEETVTGRFSGKNLNKTIQSLCALYKLKAETKNEAVILSADE